MTPARIDPILASFAPVIEPHSRIIDIGAGPGHLAREMVERLQAHVTLIDVARYNKTDLPMIVCDSRALAFDDNSFDYAVLSFVLHHCKEPEKILQEALRVSRQAIVIENDVRGRLRSIITRVVDSAQSPWYGSPPCYFTKTRDEWLDFFQGFGVETKMLKEFPLELGFFQNIAVHLTRNSHFIQTT
jgi:SAM-dependent methyltransferase